MKWFNSKLSNIILKIRYQKKEQRIGGKRKSTIFNIRPDNCQASLKKHIPNGGIASYT